MSKSVFSASCTLMCAVAILGVGATLQAADEVTAKRRLFDYFMGHQGSPISEKINGELRTIVAFTLANTDLKTPGVAGFYNMPRESNNSVIYRLISDTEYTWQTDHWQAQSRSTYDYLGASPYRTNWLYENWDSDSNRWVNTDQYVFTYDTEGKLTDAVFQTWQNGEWTSTHRTSFTYYVDGYLSSIISETWVGAWVYVYRSTLTYDSGRPQQVLG